MDNGMILIAHYMNTKTFGYGSYRGNAKSYRALAG